MKILLVKTSSLGDVVHALPALTEAAARVPGLVLDWVVEEAFTEIAMAHPAVSRVIPVSLRRWRTSWWSSRAEISAFLGRLREESYDLVIDSQGLLKSALIARLARGRSHGFDRFSAREAAAAAFYGNGHRIGTDQHAVVRQKQLLASVLGYAAAAEINYGLAAGSAEVLPQVMLLHGTTWPSKEWPESCWQDLAALIAGDGYELLVPAGSPAERDRAARILGHYRGRILDRLPLQALMTEMRVTAGVVSVDTGLGHLAPALGVPVIGLFGATSPRLTGIRGPYADLIVSDHLSCIPCRKRDCEYPIPGDSSSIYPPCFDRTTPETVWRALQQQIGSKATKPD